jgi:hypothetical protein
MTTYGLLIVDTNWTNDDKVEVGKTTHLHHKHELVEGAKALVYVRHPVDAIVAEVELTGGVIQEENVPEEPTLNPAVPESAGAVFTPSQLMEKTYSVPIRALRLKGQCEPLPINRVQMVLGSDFSAFDETWMPLTQAQYDALAALWEKA